VRQVGYVQEFVTRCTVNKIYLKNYQSFIQRQSLPPPTYIE